MPTPVSLPENWNVAVLNLVLLPLAIEVLLPSDTLLIFVVGDAVSIVQLNDEDSGPRFPTLSSALTIKI